MSVYFFITIGWVIFGVLAFGGCVAGCVHDSNSNGKVRDHVGISTFAGLLGPVGFILTAFVSNFFQHGFKFKD